MAEQDNTETVKPREVVVDLSQLGTRDVEIELEYPNTILVIPARTLTFSEWNQCDRDEPPIARVQVGAGREGPIYDDKNPDYLMAQEERRERVIYRQVVKSLRIPIHGETVEQKMQYLKDTLGVPAMAAIISGISQAHTRVKARIQNRADSFRDNGVGHAPNL